MSTLVKIGGVFNVFISGGNVIRIADGIPLPWWRIALIATNAVIAIYFVVRLLKETPREVGA